MRILFDSKNEKFKKPFGVIKDGENCSLSVHIPASCKTVNTILKIQSEDKKPYRDVVMGKSSEYDGYEVYTCDFTIEPGLYFYYFRIKTQNEEFSLYKFGYDMTNMEAGELWQLSCVPSDYTVPEFYFGKVMYQIFPDRFFASGKCDVSEKIPPFFVHENKKDIPCYKPDENGKVINCDFYGGNLRGIEEKLPYLADLGVSVIYLNPIFKAYSNHRYDTADYLKIDEMLGCDEDFKSLCDKAHSLGMKIILDGVFSHTGADSVYFDKYGRFGNGAISNPSSPYRDWYEFEHYPDKYTSWWGVEILPCVNELSESFSDFICNEVLVKWLSLGADGIRLDVADELPDEFIAKLRKKLKEIKSDALLLGEVWEDASSKISYGVRRKYFTGGELDSVMNYPFLNAIIGLVSEKCDAFAFRDTVMTICENYPSGVLLSLMNILSTHDTARILSVLGGYIPESKDERAVYRMSENARNEAVKKLMAAAFLQFMLPGMPCIFYGDEIGTEGFEDPFCRSYFDWEKTENNEICKFYKELAGLKNSQVDLQKGKTDILISGNVLTVKRGNILSHLFLDDGDFAVSGEVIFERNAGKKYGMRVERQKSLDLASDF